MICVHFDGGQICLQANASFSPFGHPTQVDASWLQYCFPLYGRACKAALRPLASPFGHPSQVCVRTFTFPTWLTCDSVWPGLFLQPFPVLQRISLCSTLCLLYSLIRLRQIYPSHRARKPSRTREMVAENSHLILSCFMQPGLWPHFPGPTFSLPQPPFHLRLLRRPINSILLPIFFLVYVFIYLFGFVLFLFFFSGPYPSLDFYKKVDNFIGPQLTTLANVICEQSAKKLQQRYTFF